MQQFWDIYFVPRKKKISHLLQIETADKPKTGCEKPGDVLYSFILQGKVVECFAWIIGMQNGVEQSVLWKVGNNVLAILTLLKTTALSRNDPHMM